MRVLKVLSAVLVVVVTLAWMWLLLYIAWLAAVNGVG